MSSTTSGLSNDITVIHNGIVVNEDFFGPGYVVIVGDRILDVGLTSHLSNHSSTDSHLASLITSATFVVDAQGGYIMPGVIDDQVHFREPGMTHKGEIATESRAALLGGVTSYMEMPNTSPAATTLLLLEQKYSRAAEVSAVNYSFYLGATNHNIDQITALDPTSVCGVKVFMGSSTGDMLVDEARMLEDIFRLSPVLVATHCEQEDIVRTNLEAAKAQFAVTDDQGAVSYPGLTVAQHPVIRSAEACYACSARAVKLAQRFGTRLHVLHISTEKELSLFEDRPLLDSNGKLAKHITNEVCVHHLWFSDADYAERGNLIKWNPAIKTTQDRAALRAGVRSNLVDVVATDHAPHTLEEKLKPYLQAPSGGPLVEHSLIAMLEMFDPQVVVRKMMHNPAVLYGIQDRGFLRPGYMADVIVVKSPSSLASSSSSSSTPSIPSIPSIPAPSAVQRGHVAAKCGWSPFEGIVFTHSVTDVFLNGCHALHNGVVDPTVRGQRLRFSR